LRMYCNQVGWKGWVKRMSSKDAPNAKLSQTVLKALDVLECVANADRPLPASEVAGLCKISRPTAYRLLLTLATRGYTAQANGPCFRLGTQALSLSRKVLDSIDLPELAKPYMRQLSDITNETVHLSILEGTEILYIAKVESSQSIRMTSTIGARSNLHSTAMGKAVLAFLPAGEQAKLLEQLKLTACTSATITGQAALVEELANVRKQRFAIDNEENEAGVRCVGAPIFDHTGHVFAAVSVSGPAYRLSVSRLEALSSLVIDTTSAISGRLGYVPQD
jgi:IclR family KDG regulon transcriptional repressor